MRYRHLIIELIVNLLLPWVAYTLVAPRWGELNGLLASAAPPLAWSLWELARTRRVDALSGLVLAGIAASVLLMLLGGDARLVLVRESLVTGVLGLLFLITLPMRQPLVYHLGRAMSQSGQAGGDGQATSRFEQWASVPANRRTLQLMTAIWGGALVLEAVVRTWLAWTLPPARFLAIGPAIGYGIYGVMMLWTLWYRRRLRARAMTAAVA
ncbi:hypothetical protein SAMN02745857_00604 [Andreprevotia lacus DSM 23236]|jgi:hypothetical protein|uniref:Intracellular septation protein A n=1 Tax=Andreprevotia lacus DSM 23236 TaxID=1121001 RepID=A0A1W1X3Y2_9NEIS|nr:VC0807 family protein [Andreprevotia lacus]SMC18664.1 hypothetical protein SAMN02745857_00604 [Andreprevotia lacus DSM 23236]